MKKEKLNKKIKLVGAGALKSTQNAITLVALVITVIVLLILAGVTINLTLGNNGIFNTAQKAAKNYTEAQNKELADLANFNNTVTDITQEMKYDKLSTKAKPGDYVKYTPAAKTFSMTPEQTGQDANQDFNTGDYTGLWQVLYNDAEHGLQIISADTVGNLKLGASGTDVTTKETTAKLAYNNAVESLNIFSENYVDTRYTVRGRSVGSNPLNPDDTTTDTQKLAFLYKDSTESGCKKPASFSRIDFEAMQTATNQNANGITNLNKTYWMASRLGGTSSDTGEFAVGLVDKDKSGNWCLWRVRSNGASEPSNFSCGVRPIIILKSDIQTSAGDGSQTSPYELVAK